MTPPPGPRCWIAGIGLLAPGLPGWRDSRASLAGDSPRPAAAPTPNRPVPAPEIPAPNILPPFALPPPALLPSTERRRTSQVVRLALAVAAEAAAASTLDPASLDTLFASSNGDGAVVAAILEALADPAGSVSPTQFHNSVHNAAAGYWGIGAGSQRPSLSLGCHDDTLPMGLLQAVAGVAVRRRPLLFCAYDLPLPEPLNAARPMRGGFALALVLLPERDATALAELSCHFGAPPPAGAAADPGASSPGASDRAAAWAGLEQSLGNPIARGLPLLRALAQGRAAALHLPMADDTSLLLELTPC